MTEKRIVTKLPLGKPVVGMKEVLSGIKKGTVKTVIVAKNCPEKITAQMPADARVFDGDQEQLGIRLGKPFFVAVVGYEEALKE